MKQGSQGACPRGNENTPSLYLGVFRAPWVEGLKDERPWEGCQEPCTPPCPPPLLTLDDLESLRQGKTRLRRKAFASQRE